MQNMRWHVKSKLNDKMLLKLLNTTCDSLAGANYLQRTQV